MNNLPIPPRPFPFEPMMALLAFAAAGLAFLPKRPVLRRVSLVIFSVLLASAAGEILSCTLDHRAPYWVFLSSGIQHALAFAAFGAFLGSTTKRRVAAAVVGGCGGFIEGVFLGWSIVAWWYLHAFGIGPGTGLLIDIGFSHSESLPYLLPPLSLWAQAGVASLAAACAARGEEGYPALAGFLLIGSPLLLIPLPSILLGGLQIFHLLFPSTPSQQCAIAGIFACGAIPGGKALGRVLRRRPARLNSGGETTPPC
jgi:hypothetical protein